MVRKLNSLLQLSPHYGISWNMDGYGHSTVKSAEAQRGFAAFPLVHLLGVEELRGRRAVTEGHLDVNRHLTQKPICRPALLGEASGNPYFSECSDEHHQFF